MAALTAISLESDNLVESSFHYILLIPLPATQVRNTTNCWLEPKAACKYVKWNECRWCDMLHVSSSGCYRDVVREEPVTSCSPKLVHVPTQEKVHRKKCLLPDTPPPPPQPQPTYGAAPPPPSYDPSPSPAAPRTPKQLSFSQPQRHSFSG